MANLKWFRVLAAAAAFAAGAAAAADSFVYAGTYTNTGSKGIYAYRFQPGSGKLTPLGAVAETGNPSFLVVHPSHRFLYAVNENGNAGVMGSVSAFAIDGRTGKLSPLNWVSSRGGSPCHLALDQTGRWLAVANYATGSIAVIPVGSDGRLGEHTAFQQHHGSSIDKARQTGPHAHAVAFSPDNRFLLAADLGLDKILVYRFDAAKGTLAPNDPPSASVKPGAGVRHIVFHPGGKALYAINEMASSVTAFRYDPAAGALEEFQTISTLPEGFTGSNSGAEIAINREGTVLYGSNRGHDSIAVFAIDPAKLLLAAIDHPPALGKTPRHFALDPTGGYLFAAHQESGTISVFRVHPRTGQLTPTTAIAKDAPRPVCVVFVPAPS